MIKKPFRQKPYKLLSKAVAERLLRRNAYMESYISSRTTTVLHRIVCQPSSRGRSLANNSYRFGIWVSFGFPWARKDIAAP